VSFHSYFNVFVYLRHVRGEGEVVGRHHVDLEEENTWVYEAAVVAVDAWVVSVVVVDERVGTEVAVVGAVVVDGEEVVVHQGIQHYQSFAVSVSRI
jgi:hypothetical protein